MRETVILVHGTFAEPIPGISPVVSEGKRLLRKA